MALDVFNSDNFKFRQLTAAITELVYQPTRIEQLGLFSYQGITKTNVSIDFGNDQVSVVPAAPRGGVGKIVTGTKYKSRPFSTIHLPQRSNVMADEVQDVRLFGSEDSSPAVQMIINRHLMQHKRNLRLTKEKHMFGAIKGEILDADNSVLLDIHAEMGTTPATHEFQLDTATTKVQNRVVALKRKIEEALGGVPYRSIRVLCGSSFFDKFVGHAKVEESWLRWNSSSNLRDDLRGGFNYGGVFFEEYRPGSGVTIEADEAWAFPEGVDEMFIGRYAPADYLSTVNQLGIEMYTNSEPMGMDKGVILETQANWLHLNTRPNAVIKCYENTAT